MFQSFGQGRRPMRAKPAKRAAGVGIRFPRSRGAALGGGLAANDNARLARFPDRPPEAAAAGIEREIERQTVRAGRENRRSLADRPTGP